MTLSPLKKLVLPPVIVTAAVFSAMTLPLALVGSKPVVIQYQEEPIFHGILRDVATPYLGLATLLSVGSGVASAAVTGWRQSSQKSALVEKQLSNLQKNLKEKEELLQTLKLSESRLQAAGLSTFLDDEASLESIKNISVPAVKPQASIAATVPQPVVLENTISEIKPVAIFPDPTLVSNQARPEQVQVAASVFPAAQTFIAYTQPNHKETATELATITSEASIVEELQNQLKQMMTQMETLQNALQTTAQGKQHEVKPAPSFKVYGAVPPSHELVQVESWQSKKAVS